jgi:hypothetical protein
LQNKDIGAKYLDMFIPALLSSFQGDSIEVYVEGIHTLTEISTYPNITIGKYCKDIVKRLKMLLDHKKRVVRKFARTCINDWENLY